MTKKYIYISNLAKETAGNIVKDRQSWIEFLTTAARFYKYQFQEQILIYAQRPNATACADIEIWNKKMNCWVNKGAKGIALIDEEAPYARLRYVFDVADVHKARRIGRAPYLWEFQEEHAGAVLERLENIYGSTSTESTFESRLLEIAERVTFDCYEEAVEDLQYSKEGSLLEELDEYSLKIHFRDTLKESISYMLLSRCGLDTENVMDELHFEYIHEFNTVMVLSQLGTFTTELCEPLLMEIGKAVWVYDREISQKTVANTSNIRYNALKRKSENSTEISNKTTQPSIEEKRQEEENNEQRIDVSEERRLLHPEYPDGRTARNNPHKIRTDEEELSEGTQERDLFGNAAVRQTDEPSVGGSGNGGAENGTSHESVGERPGSKRGTESKRSDEMGTDDEQHPAFGGGDGLSGTGLQLMSGAEKSDSHKLPGFFTSIMPGEQINLLETGREDEQYQQLSLFSSMEEQIGNITVDHAEEAFTISMESAGSMKNLISDEMVEYTLISGGGERDSRARIFAKYQKGLDHKTMVEFLKQEYQIGGKGFTFEGEPLCVWYEENGMKFTRGTAARHEPMLTLSWEEVEERTYNLIASGRYMEEAEMWQVPMQEKKELASKIYFFFRDEYGSMPKELTEKNYSYTKEEDELMEHLSTPEGIDKILSHMDQAIGEIERGEAGSRIRLIYRSEDIRRSVSELKRESISYPSAERLEVPQETFITQDEIDYKLSRGSNISGGLFRIYEFFLHNQDKKEQADFLKNEYGIGGSSPGLVGAWHSYADFDAKGLRLSKGSIFEPSAKILLTWRKVAERIRKLIDMDRLLTPEAKEQYARWKAEKEQSVLKHAKEGLHQEAVEPEPKEQMEPYLEKERFADQSKEDTLELLEPDLETPDRKTEAEPVVDTPLAVNYRITNDALGNGSAREKFDRNVAAIVTLQLIEREKRTASLEEQEMLAGYVGWGGLSEAFDGKNSAWHDQYLELKSLLNEQEYNSARESTLNAHYTSPIIIRSIYSALKNMGFEKGNILEPSMGTGNFFGMLPDTMQDSRLYGVELDSLTGRIARQLYPKAKIQVTGFEKTDYPNDLFDVVVGNVPFGQYKVGDKPYDKHNFLIHDYFLVKSLDKVRSGGIIAVVTSRGTMDKKSTAARKYLAQRAELLGAVRLPNTAFLENAGTKVTSDILFLKKRDRMIETEAEWVHLGENEDGIAMNQYFIDHPEMVVGKMELVSAPYSMEPTCQPKEGRAFAEQLREALSCIRGEIKNAGLYELEDDMEKSAIPADPDVKNYSYTIVDGEVYYRENSVMKLVDMSSTFLERIKGMVTIRNVTSELIQYQLEEYGDAVIKEKQAELSQLYDVFTKKYGLINSQSNKRAFNQDSSYCLLCSLEILNEDGTLDRKADMFTKRTIKKWYYVKKKYKLKWEKSYLFS